MLNGFAEIPLYSVVRDQLRSEIHDGCYPQDKPIPSEAAIGARFGVSRITVRHALGELQREGLIYKVTGRGAFVNKPRVQQAVNRLEGFGEAMTRLGFASSNRVLRMRRTLAPATVAAVLGVAPDKPVSEIIWLRNLDGAPYCYELSWLPLDIGQLLTRDQLETRDLFAILEQDHGLRLGVADLNIEAVLAGRAQAKWLATRLGRPCLCIERLTRLASGRPANFDHLFFRGDAFRYSLRIERQYAFPVAGASAGSAD